MKVNLTYSEIDGIAAQINSLLNTSDPEYRVNGLFGARLSSIGRKLTTSLSEYQEEVNSILTNFFEMEEDGKTFKTEKVKEKGKAVKDEEGNPVLQRVYQEGCDEQGLNEALAELNAQVHEIELPRYVTDNDIRNVDLTPAQAAAISYILK